MMEKTAYVGVVAEVICDAVEWSFSARYVWED